MKIGQAFVLNRGLVDYVRGAGLGLAICKGTVFTITMRADSHGPVKGESNLNIAEEVAS